MAKWMGMALMPQAGVALGLALLAVQQRPDLGGKILPVVIASTVLFELIGPLLTRLALIRSRDSLSESGGKNRQPPHNN